MKFYRSAICTALLVINMFDTLRIRLFNLVIHSITIYDHKLKCALRS